VFESNFVKKFLEKREGSFMYKQKFLDISLHMRKPVLKVLYILFYEENLRYFFLFVHPSCLVLTSIWSFVHSGEVFMYRGAER
jgi:hypothetical protein